MDQQKAERAGVPALGSGAALGSGKLVPQDTTLAPDIGGANEIAAFGSDTPAAPAASEDGSEGGDGRGDDDGTSTDTSKGMGGGTVAALIMGVLAVVGLVVGVLKWRSNSNANRQPQQMMGVEATHQNPTFGNGDDNAYVEPSATQAAMYDNGKIVITSTGGAVYAVPTESGSSAQPVVYATYAGGAGGANGANGDSNGIRNNQNMDADGYQVDGYCDDVASTANNSNGGGGGGINQGMDVNGYQVDGYYDDVEGSSRPCPNPVGANICARGSAASSSGRACKRTVVANSRFCAGHTCKLARCFNTRSSSEEFCAEHGAPESVI